MWGWDGEGLTWSSQLTPGYLPDWICSSSHGLSLSRPGCCMLQSKASGEQEGVGYRRVTSYAGASDSSTLLWSSDLIIGEAGAPFMLHRIRPITDFSVIKISLLLPKAFLTSKVAPPITGSIVYCMLVSSWARWRWSMMEWRVVKVLLQVFNISPETEHAEDGHYCATGTIKHLNVRHLIRPCTRHHSGYCQWW